MTLIESSVQDHAVDNVPKGNAIILDGMALIQATKKLPSSFGEFAEQLFFKGDKVGNLSQILACRFCGRQISRYKQ